VGGVGGGGLVEPRGARRTVRGVAVAVPAVVAHAFEIQGRPAAVAVAEARVRLQSCLRTEAVVDGQADGVGMCFEDLGLRRAVGAV